MRQAVTCRQSLVRIILFGSLISCGQSVGGNSSCANCCSQLKKVVECRDVDISVIPPPPTNGNTRSRGYCSYCGGHTHWGDTTADGIRTLDLSRSKFKEISDDVHRYFPNVEDIIADKNMFTSLGKDAFRLPGQTSPLTKISLRMNFIEEIHPQAFAGLSNLKKLDLTGNHLRSLPDEVFDPLGNLTELHLDLNQFIAINPRWFLKLANLKTLSFSSNFIETVPPLPDALGQLCDFNLRNNSVASISANAFNRLRKLWIINLSDNRLREIDENLFRKNYELLNIDLSRNRLKSLSRNFVSHLCSLKLLDISSNLLSTAYYDWFATIVYNCDTEEKQCKRNLEATANNQWRCDEDMNEFALFMSDISREYKLNNQGWNECFKIICVSPEEVKGVSLTSTKSQYSSSDRIHENPNRTCAGHPICPYLSTKCTENPVPLPEKLSQSARTPVMGTLYAVVGIAVLAAMTLSLYVVFRKRRMKKARKSSESSEDSIMSTSGYDELESLVPAHYQRPRLPPEGLSETASHSSESERSSQSLLGNDEYDNQSNTSETVPKTLSNPRDETTPKSVFNSDETVPKRLRPPKNRRMNCYSNPEQVINQFKRHPPNPHPTPSPGYTHMNDLLPPTNSRPRSIPNGKMLPLILSAPPPPNSPAPHPNYQRPIERHQYEVEIPHYPPPSQPNPNWEPHFPNNRGHIPDVSYDLLLRNNPCALVPIPIEDMSSVCKKLEKNKKKRAKKGKKN